MNQPANSLPHRDLAGMVAQRAKLLAQTRRYFDRLGFSEVTPPCLSRDQVVDAHIDPVEVNGDALLLPADCRAPVYYLQTSPELAMKRLIALGCGSIYAIVPVFRAGERSVRHNIEFTMLEWYEVGGSMASAIQHTISLVTTVLQIPQPRLVTYRQLFRQTLGFDPIDQPLDSLHDAVATVDPHLAGSLRDQRDALLDVLMTEIIEPQIASESLLIHNYPLTQAALARQCPDDPQTAERFEWIVHGLELANGYGELLDHQELSRRNAESNQKRLATGRKPLPETNRLLDAMQQGMPPCSGVALGFDRLLMLAIGTRDIADVIPFPIELA